MNATEDEKQVGEEPSVEEIFYAEWGLELIKESLTFLNTTLRQLVTLSAALLGGAIAVSDKPLLKTDLMPAVAVLLFAALFFSTLGLLPAGRVAGIWDADAVRRMVRDGMWWKRWALKLTVFSLLAAMFCMVVAVFAKHQ